MLSDRIEQRIDPRQQQVEAALAKGLIERIESGIVLTEAEVEDGVVQ